MTVFLENSLYIDMFLGEVKLENIKYIPSRFNHIAKYNGLFLIHNTFTKGAVALDFEEYNAYSNANSESSIYKKLIQLRYLVPENTDEYKLFLQVYNIVDKFTSKNYINGFNIFITTDCNARCFYCFEAGVKKEHMTEETAKDVVKYIKKVSAGKRVSIRWFGGEPLYNIEAIDVIAKGLKEQGISFSSYITTNGYLFDKNIIERAKNIWNLKYAQITIDGTETNYNRIKNYIYKDVNSPYKRVLSNIHDLLKKGIDVNVQINLYKEYDDIDILIDELSNEFSSFSGFKICPNCIVDNKNKSSFSVLEKEMQLQKFFSVIEKLKKENLYPKSKLNLNILGNVCMANDKHHTLILPNGDLAKCDLHYDKSVYGSIYSETINSGIIESYNEKHPLGDLCRTCACLPNCHHTKLCALTKGVPCNALQRQARYDFLSEALIREYQNRESVNKV